MDNQDLQTPENNANTSPVSAPVNSTDPFANLTMGRAEWLHGDLEAALPWMQRSTDLSPNYAFAIYNSALMGALLGEGEQSEQRVMRAIELSPIDPLNYAMLGTRAWSHIVRGNYSEASRWADQAVQSPNAHFQIFVIAAVANELSGEAQSAKRHAARLRQINPRFEHTDFFDAFPVQPVDTRRRVSDALGRLFP